MAATLAPPAISRFKPRREPSEFDIREVNLRKTVFGVDSISARHTADFEKGVRGRRSIGSAASRIPDVRLHQRFGGTKQEALQVRAANQSEGLTLRVGFNPFGDDTQAKAFSQMRD